MTKINQLITQIKALSNCSVYNPEGIPKVAEEKHVLPKDLLEFYSLCGGIVLFENEEYPIHIVTPEEFTLAIQ